MSRLWQCILANVRLLRWTLINVGVGLAPFLLNLFFWLHGTSSDIWKFVGNSPDIWFITVTLCLTTLADLMDSALAGRIEKDRSQIALLAGCGVAVIMFVASGFYFMKTEQGIKLSEIGTRVVAGNNSERQEKNKEHDSPYHMSTFCLSIMIALCTMYGTIEIERRIILIEEVKS